jgi:hypothetical protein
MDVDVCVIAGAVTTIAGGAAGSPSTLQYADGACTKAVFGSITCVRPSATGQHWFVCDAGHNVVRRVTVNSGELCFRAVSRVTFAC